MVICTYNRDKFILSSLEHLIDQSLSKDEYEIIVVDNNCTDNTVKIVKQFIAEHDDYDIRLVKETNQGLSFARNRGIKESKYDIICYIDDDGNAQINYLELIQQQFKQKSNLVGLGGKVIPIYETEEPAWYNPFLRMFVTAIDFGDKEFRCYGKKYPAGCSMIYTKDILIEAGGFNNDLKWRADDKYIFHEVIKHSREVYHIPTLKVNHHIDAKRLTDENFDRLSGLLGSEERLRILGKKPWLYPFKICEFLFKYFATYLISLYYTLKGQSIKGKYVRRFRWHALLHFLFAKK